MSTAGASPRPPTGTIPGAPVSARPAGSIQGPPSILVASRTSPAAPSNDGAPPAPAAHQAKARADWGRPAQIGSLSAPVVGAGGLHLVAGRTVVVADTETGGLPAPGGSFADIALLSVALVIPRERGAMAREWHILPAPGLRVDPGATRINGFSPERWRALGAIGEDQALREIVQTLDAHRGPHGIQMLAHGATFDGAVLRAAFRRSGVPGDPPADWGCTLCAADDLRQDGYQGSRSLGAVHHHLLGYPLDGAHGAQADARAAGRVAEILWASGRTIPAVSTG